MTRLSNILNSIQRIYGLIGRIPYSAVILPARIATFSVFFRSGLVKISDWNATLALFRDEYRVPVLPPEFAAHMAAAMELGLSTLVLVGLFTRLGVFGLLGMIAVIQIFVEPMGWPDHVQWVAFMLFILWRGPGAISLDFLLARFFSAGEPPERGATTR
jgi:putative oxidoreductase